jgi:photosystem II stability/assembly factor-like uncharacterized protein
MQTKVLRYFAISLLLLCYQVAWAKNGLNDTANALAIQPGETSTMYAGTSGGLLVNRDGAWYLAGLEQKNVIDIVIPASDPQILFAVTDEEGLHKSNNAGKNWTLLQTHVNGIDYEVKTITVSPADTSVIVAASKDGYILKSTNGGDSWRVINPDFPLTAINTVALHPDDDQTIFVGTGGNGILKSTDGGNTWTMLNNRLNDLTVTRLLISSQNASLLFAGTYGGGVFKSMDGGKNWQAANEGLSDTFVYALAMLPDSRSTNDFMGFLRNQVNKLKDEGSVSEIFAGVFGGDIYSTLNYF